jgi:hypothetical protein
VGNNWGRQIKYGEIGREFAPKANMERIVFFFFSSPVVSIGASIV